MNNNLALSSLNPKPSVIARSEATRQSSPSVRSAWLDCFISSLTLSSQRRGFGKLLYKSKYLFLRCLFIFHIGRNSNAIHVNLIRNFERFGGDFGAKSIHEFEELAIDFFHNAAKNGAHNNLYSFVILPKQRIGIDYNGEYRAIYEKGGKPIAFFRPSYRDAGYTNKQQELADWKSGRNAGYYARAPLE